MEKKLSILLIFIFLIVSFAIAENETAYEFERAKKGEYVSFWGGGVFELTLFTSSYDNPDLIMAELDSPLPADGCILLVRVRAVDDWYTHEEFEENFSRVLCLYTKSDRIEFEPITVVSLGGYRDWDFDLFYYCPEYRPLDDFEFLGAIRIFSLDDLPNDGSRLIKPSPSPTPEPTAEPTPSPTPEPLPKDIAALNSSHITANKNKGKSIEDAICTGDVVVAIYDEENENALPEILTVDSDDAWLFPREYRAASYDEARWAVIIYPDYKTVGHYKGTGGSANRTTTYLSLFDLETGEHYKVKVATEEPPSTITVTRTKIGAAGKFRSDQAINMLTELIETTLQKQQETKQPGFTFR